MQSQEHVRRLAPPSPARLVRAVWYRPGRTKPPARSLEYPLNTDGRYGRLCYCRLQVAGVIGNIHQNLVWLRPDVRNVTRHQRGLSALVERDKFERVGTGVIGRRANDLAILALLDNVRRPSRNAPG